MILICRLAVDPDQAHDFLTRACRALGRSPDEVTRWVLAVRFESVVAYRRALSVFEVREHVVPLLSEALTGEPGSYEVLADAQGGAVADHGSLLAQDAERGFGFGDR